MGQADIGSGMGKGHIARGRGNTGQGGAEWGGKGAVLIHEADQAPEGS